MCLVVLFHDVGTIDTQRSIIQLQNVKRTFTTTVVQVKIHTKLNEEFFDKHLKVNNWLQNIFIYTTVTKGNT